MTTHRLEGQQITGQGRLADYANLVKRPHTVFAMPFALAGATTTMGEATPAGVKGRDR